MKTIFYLFAMLIHKILFLSLQDKIYILAPPCNIPYMYHELLQICACVIELLDRNVDQVLKIYIYCMSYQRVVVVEDILHLKTSLEEHRKDLSPEKLIEILEKLKLMKPSKEVLKYTKIGRTVNSLRRSTSQPVRELSKLIVKNWKKLVEEETTVKEVIDVRCDAKTELLRSKGRKLIAAALDVNVSELT